MSGVLYLCATPIGNLEDITLRVLRLLRECDLIATEDTRQTLKLLNRYNIKTPITSYHEHNKKTKGSYLIERLLEGKSIALVTDAGMPGISDPGYDLAKLCIENNINVTAAPGATAGLTALIISGFSTKRIAFEGFLPYDKKSRRNVLEELKEEGRTIILYEAPHRLLETLKELYSYLGDRNIAIIKELTKLHETVLRTSLLNSIDYYNENPPKGEFVLVVEGISDEEKRSRELLSLGDISIEEHFNRYIKEGMSKMDAIKRVAKARGFSKREIYTIINKEE